MKMFILPTCPHCNNARRWIDELKSENEAYNSIEIELINEEKDVDLANSYDYYYVPSIFDGTKKLHEGVASKEGLKNIFDEYLSSKHEFTTFLLDFIVY